MKVLLAVGAVLLLPACGYAQGPKACEDLKSEIATKLDGKGVKGYSLEVVPKDQEVTDGKVVGTCEGGTKKIVYRRGATTTTPQTPAKEPSKP
jgi:hypothetical protein